MPQIITEDDDELETGAEGQTQQNRADTAESGLQPVRRDPIELGSEDAGEYDIIETDADGRPIGTAGATDARMIEDGQDTILGRRHQQDLAGGDGQRGQQQMTARARRRASQRYAKERNIAEKAKLEREVGELRQRLERFEGTATAKFSENEERQIQEAGRQLEERLAKLNRDVDAADNEFLDALESGDRALTAKALAKRDNARIQAVQAQNQKAAFDYQVQQRKAQLANGGGQATDGQQRDAGQQSRGTGQRTTEAAEGPTLSDRGMRYVTEFRSDFAWVDKPRTRDDQRDSKLVQMLDEQVAREGYDPNTEEYWDVLEERMQEYMPHRFDDGNSSNGAANGNGAQQRNVTQNTARRGPPVGSAETRSQTQKNQVRITPERKQSLIDDGILDISGTKVLDQMKFKRRLKYFDQFDRENPVVAR